jgi:hypothetical protein
MWELRTSTFHGCPSLPFFRREEAETALDTFDQTEEILVLRDRGDDGSSPCSESGLDVLSDLGELSNSTSVSGLGVLRSCLMASRGARDSASRCMKPIQEARLSASLVRGTIGSTNL